MSRPPFTSKCLFPLSSGLLSSTGFGDTRISVMPIVSSSPTTLNPRRDISTRETSNRARNPSGIPNRSRRQWTTTRSGFRLMQVTKISMRSLPGRARAAGGSASYFPWTPFCFGTCELSPSRGLSCEDCSRLSQRSDRI